MTSIPLPQAETTIHAPLNTLAPGRCAAVTRIEAQPLIEARLSGMGLCVGRRVEMVQHGDPMIVRACGTRIGLSRELSDAIMVEACEETCSAPSPSPPSPFRPTHTL